MPVKCYYNSADGHFYAIAFHFEIACYQNWKKLKISQNTLNGMNMNENECTWKIPSRGCHYCEKVQVLHNMTLEMS